MFLTTKILMYIIQGLALFFAIKNWKFYKDGKQRFFLHFMVYVIITEIVAYTITFFPQYDNDFVYNIFTLVSFLFYFFWYYKLLISKRILINLLSISFIIVNIISIIKGSFFAEILSFPVLVGALSVVLLTSLMFVKIIRDKESINYKKSQKFWLATGLLIFYVGYLPLPFFLNVLDAYSFTYGFLMMLLNILLYGCFIIAFNLKTE